MTGFATAEVSAGAYKLVWEIRSVNHRYLDLGFRLPDEFRALETRLRGLLGAEVKRGKVDCTLKLLAIGADQAQAEIDTEQLSAVGELQNQILQQDPSAARLSVFEILRWPGVLKDDAGRKESLVEPALQCFSEAVSALRAARAGEGIRLAEMLHERLTAISELMTAVNDQIATQPTRYRDKLLERLEKLDVELNPERLEQELALIAQRSDVAEEADRLKSHVQEITDVLALDEPIGRRLDFLIQELNREANTLASKVQDDELARRAVDLKVLVEQMREQVQNIE